MRNVLVVAAHPDDEILGVGGTAKRLFDEGIVVRAVILAEGLTPRCEKRSDTTKIELLNLQKSAYSAAKEVGYSSIDFCGFPDSRMDEVDLLDIVKTVSKYVAKYDPNTIFTHHHGDLNIDRRITCEAVLTACRPVGKYNVQNIYAFETPSSTEWNYSYLEPFKTNVYIDVSETWKAKIKGTGHYETESTSFPHPRSAKALEALGVYRGSNAGLEMAEGFVLLRQTIENSERGRAIGLNNWSSFLCCQHNAAIGHLKDRCIA